MISIKIPWQVYACAGVILSLIGSYWYGLHVKQEEWDASRERGKEILSRLKERQITITKGVLVQRETKIEYVYLKGETVVKEIPKYIPLGTPDLPWGFRLLHDRAALGTVPGASEATNGDPVPVRTATETVVRNYTTCHAMREDFYLLRSWVQEQREAYLAECKRRGVSCSMDK